MSLSDTMTSIVCPHATRRFHLLLGSLLASAVALLAPAGSQAAIRTFGSPLAVPATLNTAENLGYVGTYTPLPDGVFHTFHYGADTALWSVRDTAGLPSVPTGGQALKISLEGCARPASGGPTPLTQIHFQDVTPLPGGGVKVNLTSGAFEIPVCGVHGVNGSTVSTYKPRGLCVSRGDYVAFNDEGGYVENIYRAGVPYQVLGSVRGSTTDSFIKNEGTGNGAMMRSSETSANEGFASNRDEELMMRVTLGTGPDARYVCPGGSKDAPPVLPTIDIHPQTDGINRSHIVGVAVYCRPARGCRGTAALTLDGATNPVGRAGFRLAGDHTSHVSIRVSSSLMTLIRQDHGVSTKCVAVVNGKRFTQTVTIKIL
jgi:hypothetical protein